MASLLVFHPLLRRVWDAFNNKSTPRRSPAANRLEQRASFDFAFGILFLFILHGISCFKILTILFLNYQVSKTLPRRYVPLATWVFNIGTLFANEMSKGYPLRVMAGYISPPSQPGTLSGLMQWGMWLDGYSGLLARWEVSFNITVLRLISFNLDYYWSIDKNNANAIEVRHYPGPSTE